MAFKDLHAQKGGFQKHLSRCLMPIAFDGSEELCHLNI